MTANAGLAIDKIKGWLNVSGTSIISHVISGSTHCLWNKWTVIQTILPKWNNCLMIYNRTLSAISWEREQCNHYDDAHFPRYCPFVRRNHQWPMDSSHNGQWHGAFMISLICAWTNGWGNNGDAGDLRRHPAHYDVTLMATTHVVQISAPKQHTVSPP